MFIRFRGGLAAMGFLFLAASSAAQAATPCHLVQQASLDASLEHGRVTTTVDIDGRQTRLLIDTGADFGVFSSAVAEQLQMPRTIIRGATITDVSGRSAKYTVKAKLMTFGHFKVANVPFIAVDAWKESANGIDGSFGAAFLAAYDVEFDFAHGKMNLFEQNEACGDRIEYWSDELVTIPFKLDASTHIVIPVTLDGKQLTAMIDTGAPRTTLLSSAANRLFDRDLPDGSKEGSHTVGGFNGGSLATYRSHFGKLEVGGIAFNNVDIQIMQDRMSSFYRHDKSDFATVEIEENQQMKADLILGLTELSKLRLLIAYSQNKIYATAADAK